MTKIALITDQHFGSRNDDVRFADYFKKFYDELFFPYLKQNDIKYVIDLGDTLDRRKYVNFNTFQKMKEMWLEPLKENGITYHSIVGNHTSYFKNTNRVNSCELLFHGYDNVHVHSETTEIEIDEFKFLIIPWINSSNYEETVGKIKNSDAKVALGHLELKGFQMYKNSVNDDHGFETDIFKKFDLVCSGHFHHKSTKGNISYLGAPYEMTWSDYDDTRGFHVFDTNTRELFYIINPFKMFHKIFYDDSKDENDIMSINFEEYKNAYIKIVVKNKNNAYLFDKFVDKFEQIGAFDIQIVDDYLNLELEDTDEIIDEAEDTLTILKNYVTQINTGIDNKNVLLTFIRELYEEAIIQE